jgi:t-SNARE complex subunit (syntaxin)
MSHYAIIEKALDEREHNQRNELRKVIKKIHQVKELSRDIRDELDIQDECIEDLEFSVDSATETVVSVTERVKRFMGNAGEGWHAFTVVVLLFVFITVCFLVVLIGGL